MTNLDHIKELYTEYRGKEEPSLPAWEDLDHAIAGVLIRMYHRGREDGREETFRKSAGP
jgi:hypothetical protein